MKYLSLGRFENTRNQNLRVEFTDYYLSDCPFTEHKIRFVMHGEKN